MIGIKHFKARCGMAEKRSRERIKAKNQVSRKGGNNQLNILRNERGRENHERLRILEAMMRSTEAVPPTMP